MRYSHTLEADKYIHTYTAPSPPPLYLSLFTFALPPNVCIAHFTVHLLFPMHVFMALIPHPTQTPFLTQGGFMDVVEERSKGKRLCGYPICSKKITMPAEETVIRIRNGQLYDVKDSTV